jgi:Predicted permeases
MIKYIALPIVGFLVGILIISLGGGGGAVYVGILTGIFNIPPSIATSTSLATIIPSAAAGTFSHWKAGNVNFRFGLTMLGGGIIGCVAGSLCSGLLPQSLYNKLIGVIMLLLSIQMCVSFLKKKRKVKGKSENPEVATALGVDNAAINVNRDADVVTDINVDNAATIDMEVDADTAINMDETAEAANITDGDTGEVFDTGMDTRATIDMEGYIYAINNVDEGTAAISTDIGNETDKGKKSDIIKAVVFGVLGGAMAGLVGLSGGGPIIAGLSIMGCGALETVGTSVLVLLGISIIGFGMHLGIGGVDWRLVGLLIIGTMSGAFVGPILLKRIDKKKMEKILQPLLLLLIVVMGILLLFK